MNELLDRLNEWLYTESYAESRKKLRDYIAKRQDFIRKDVREKHARGEFKTTEEMQAYLDRQQYALELIDQFREEAEALMAGLLETVEQQQIRIYDLINEKRQLQYHGSTGHNAARFQGNRNAWNEHRQNLWADHF